MLGAPQQVHAWQGPKLDFQQPLCELEMDLQPFEALQEGCVLSALGALRSFPEQ